MKFEPDFWVRLLLQQIQVTLKKIFFHLSLILFLYIHSDKIWWLLDQILLRNGVFCEPAVNGDFWNNKTLVQDVIAKIEKYFFVQTFLSYCQKIWSCFWNFLNIIALCFTKLTKQEHSPNKVKYDVISRRSGTSIVLKCFIYSTKDSEYTD